MRRFIQRGNSLTCALLLHLCFSYGQQITVKGTVHGADGPLEGASIAVSQKKTLTDRHGGFTLTLKSGQYILYVTHAGYKEITKEIKLDTSSVAFEFTMIAEEEMSEVTILGSRFATQRSNLSTPVPVDVISSRQLLQTSQVTLTQMLQFTVPSFNASRPLVNEPVNLRGLDPDQVLILVNGKRYHNMSFVNFGGVRGILGRGAVSNDLNSIPFSAIEKIEVLRDGASAQYGSDAIAGVINVQLKRSSDKTFAQLQTGQFYKGDGATLSVGINHGMTFLKKGFLNLSGAYRFQDPTSRGGVYKGTVYKNYPPGANHDDSMRIQAQDDSTVRARNFDRSRVTNAGSSSQVGFSSAANGGFPVTEKTEVFWTLLLNHRVTTFTSSYTLPRDANRINPDLFPDGFKSKPSNHVTDLSGIAGASGETKNRWLWEVSSDYGINLAKFHNKETNNASQYFSLGKNAPTSFYTGSAVYGQLSNNVQFSKLTAQTPKAVFKLATGAEWRMEHYRIEAGEEASWSNYDATGRKLGGSGGLVFSPRDAVSTDRQVLAVYTDMETEFRKRFLIGTAIRYEYYSDFGGNLAGKLAARYALGEKFSLRASLSNGFRAPSLQQRYYSQTRIAPSMVAGTYTLVTSGFFPGNSNVVKALGIAPLQAEQSLNLGAGLTASASSRINLTVDGYWIQIKNRIVLSGVFNRVTNANVNELLKDITDVNLVQFFANAINTQTKGLDIVLSGNWRIRKDRLRTILAANFTQTRLFGEIERAGNLRTDSLNTNTLFSVEENTRLQHGQPDNKIILSVIYSTEKLEVIVRNTRFGKTAIAPAYADPKTRVTSFIYESFSPKILTDISVTYSLRKCISITLGANNTFNVCPQRSKEYLNTGEGNFIYSQEASPFGFNGGYYFLSAELKL